MIADRGLRMAECGRASAIGGKIAAVGNAKVELTRIALEPVRLRSGAERGRSASNQVHGGRGLKQRATPGRHRVLVGPPPLSALRPPQSS